MKSALYASVSLLLKSVHERLFGSFSLRNSRPAASACVIYVPLNWSCCSSSLSFQSNEWTGFFSVKRIFHFIWLSVPALLRVSRPVALDSSYLSWKLWCLSPPLQRNSINYLQACIFYWCYFQVTIHNVVGVKPPAGSRHGGRQWAHYLALL